MSSAIDRENSLGLLAGKKLFYLSMIGRMPVSQDSSIINDYSKVKEQVIMVIEYLQQIKDSYFEQKHALEKQLNLLEIQLKENTGMIKMLEETNDSCYELFTPRNVNSKNKAKINELMEEQKSINESIENLKNSIKEYSSKIEQLDQIVKEENREIEIVQEYTETMTQQNIVSEDEKESSEDNLLDSMKNILNRLELCSQLIDIDPVRCRLELSSVMKILTDLIEEKDESDF
jgi:chromosome segregation ATPase